MQHTYLCPHSLSVCEELLRTNARLTQLGDVIVYSDFRYLFFLVAKSKIESVEHYPRAVKRKSFSIMP